MKKYQYQILRYVHDQFTGEFVNIGVVVYSPEATFLDTIVCHKYGRITAMFPTANGRFILKTAKNFESAIRNFSRRLGELYKPSENLENITNSILPNDDSALMLTKVSYAIDIDMEIALKDLYVDMVEKYIHNDSSIQTLSDDDVWRKKYKAHFDRYKITDRLSSHIVKTKNDSFNFQKSWKNEIWHCYEPVSFELQNEDSIKDKVYKWTGRLREIENTNEKINITFLATLPSIHHKLNKLITESLNHASSNVNVDIVVENQAEQFAKAISNLINAHDHHNM